MQVRNRTTRSFLSQQRPGFTLVEMLVALGLVALLMALFAQVFQSATNTMSTQRGIMENDQRARVITTVLTNDLKYRTMTSVMPFQPGETDYPTASYYSFSERQGYFSISENDPNNTADDVLSFTTQLPVTVEPYYGKGTALSNPFYGSVDLGRDQNQPDADDSLVLSNNTVSSTTAEIVYFLRNGNLYRRVMLIRTPLDIAYDRQPNYLDTDSPPNQKDFFDPLLSYLNNPVATLNPVPYPFGSDFWQQFDFSARFQTAAGGARFVGGGGLNPLDNRSLTDGGTGGGFPIGIPLNRFGHNPDASSGNENGSVTTASVGNPREFLGTTFLGRFTQEETSHPTFNFPHSLSSQIDDHDSVTGIPTVLINDGNPMKIIASTNPLTDSDSNGIVDQYTYSGDLNCRRGEDIILTHVHEFDVKVWDEVIGDYVDVGHTLTFGGTNGDFHQNRNQRISYGPDSTMTNNWVFDTWNPNFDADNSDNNFGISIATDANDFAPYVPKSNYSTFTAWTASTAYNVGDIVIPTTANSATSTFYFKCTVAGTSDVGEPAWSRIDGATFIDGSVVWQAVLNLKRLKSMKITIRYYDVSSDQMRQVTLIKSLLD